MDSTSRRHDPFGKWPDSTITTEERQTPVEFELPLADLEARISQLGLTRAEEDDQTKVFKTPVTAEVLSQPTEG